ncbi:hypothetical protein ABPG74_004756 [Tetrahymena malaccensis]
MLPNQLTLSKFSFGIASKDSVAFTSLIVIPIKINNTLIIISQNTFISVNTQLLKNLKYNKYIALNPYTTLDIIAHSNYFQNNTRNEITIKYFLKKDTKMYDFDPFILQSISPQILGAFEAKQSLVF